MTSSRTKITLSRWEDNRPTSRSLSYLDQYDVDSGIESINKKLRETRFIEPIEYNKQNDKIREATELLNETVKYISGVIDDVDELIDEPFFQAYNKADGVLEDLKRIVLDDYKVKNTLGITEEVIDYANSSSMADLATKEIVKETIGLKDLLHNEDISGVGELQSFSELFKEQYETLSEANEDLANMSYGEYVEGLIGRGNIQHTVDKGWLNVLGDALDIIGITSLIGCFTGTNVFTGQILTPGERKSAAFTAIINIGSLALAISTAGAGSLLALGLKGATKVVATTTFKWCMVNMISGMSGLLVGGVLDMLGAPTWLKIAGTLGGAALGRSIANKTLFKTAVKGTLEDIAGADSFDDWLKNMSPEDAARYQQRLDLLEGKIPNTIDGRKVIDGMVDGKIPIDEYLSIRDASIHNAYSDSMTLGKWNDDGVSYLTSAKDNGSMFFDLGDDWNVIKNKYDITDTDMFEIFNKPAIDEAVRNGQVIRFSHDPRLDKYIGSALDSEWKYLQEIHGFKKLNEIEVGVWIAIR